MARALGILTAALAGTTFLIAGCGGSDDKPKAAPPSSSPPTTTAAVPATPSAEDQAREQILAAFAKYAAADDKVKHEGRANTDDVSSFMTGNAKLEWQIGGLNLEKDSRKVVGDVVRAPQVSSLDLASDPARATLAVCLDTSAVKLVNSITGEAVPTKPQAPRYVQAVTAVRQNGNWLIDTVKAERDRPC